MSLYGSNVEQGLHCLMYLIDLPAGTRLSSRDLAEFQGVSTSFVAKLFTQLKKAGLANAAEGIRGGFALAKPAQNISILDVVDALEPDKALFRCRDIRENCVLFEGNTPPWASRGVCAINAAMLSAQRDMRQSLAHVSLRDLKNSAGKYLPSEHVARGREWFEMRQSARAPQSKKHQDGQ